MCRICRRSREEASLAGFLFAEPNLCAECAQLKEALRRMHAERGGVNLNLPKMRAELERRAGVTHG